MLAKSTLGARQLRRKILPHKAFFNLFLKMLCLLVCFRAVLVGLVVATFGEMGLQQHQQQ
jgi:hypothetical protein